MSCFTINVTKKTALTLHGAERLRVGVCSRITSSSISGLSFRLQVLGYWICGHRQGASSVLQPLPDSRMGASPLVLADVLADEERHVLLVDELEALAELLRKALSSSGIKAFVSRPPSRPPAPQPLLSSSTANQVPSVIRAPQSNSHSHPKASASIVTPPPPPPPPPPPLPHFSRDPTGCLCKSASMPNCLWERAMGGGAP